MINGMWWKFLGVALVIYSIVAGIAVPLKPDITSYTPTRAKAGERINLEITGYNTQFKEGDQVRAWLKDDEGNLLKATGYAVQDEKHIRTIFQIPPFLVSKDQVVPLSIILDHPRDGAMTMSDALFVSQEQHDINQGKAYWSAELPSDLQIYDQFSFPNQNILYESIRNLFYHVPMWFAMIFILGTAVFWSIKFLMNPMERKFDHRAVAYTDVGVLLGILGLATGALWAKFAWGQYWSWDIKQTTSAIAMLIYIAYFILRNAIEDEDRRGRVAAVFNIFAFAALIPLIFVVPRAMESLHPGNGGNPGLGVDDLDNTMRMVFYPAIIGWILISTWMSNVRSRILDVDHYLSFK